MGGFDGDGEWAYSDERRVCAKCFDDDDLSRFIRSGGGRRGCDFCRRRDAPTVTLGEIAEYIAGRLGAYYGKAVDQLPYESAEGGYQGWHPDTYDLLFDTIGLELPRDDDNLARALVDEIGDDIWCAYDWLTLEPDESLRFSWSRFCEVVKHQRRFFSKMSVGVAGIPTLALRPSF